MVTIHSLKILPESFKAVCNGYKKAEFRRTDREIPFAVGDRLYLREWLPPVVKNQVLMTFYDGCYSGHSITVEITHIVNGDDINIVPIGYAMLSFKLVQPEF